MKQKTLTMIPVLCAAVAPLCADAQGSQQANKSADQQQQQMYMQEINKITPTAEPAVSRWADPYLTADYIFWKAQTDGLEYAFKGTTTVNRDADQGEMHHPHFEYDSGFKVGGGLKFRHDGWDVFVQYTWLHHDEEDKRSAFSDVDGDSQVQSNISLPINGDFETVWCQKASADWKLHFNVLDAELGRNFWISKWLTLRPFIGMKFSWNKQFYNVEYDFVVNESLIATGTDIEMRHEQHQFGVGARAGLNTSWYMWNKWIIYGDFAISGIWNSFTSYRKDELEFLNGTELVQNNIKQHAHPVTTVLEWALGLRFETAFHNDDYMWQLQVGWEAQAWLDQNHFIFMPNGSHGDLTMQGLVVKTAFWF